MEPVIHDDLGPWKVIQINEPSVGLQAVVAIDNVACGPAIGGVRMAPDVSVDEAVRLARAMTLKNAAAGLPHGGGKSVIYADPKMAVGDKELLVRAFACSIENEVNYIPGPDMGTDEEAMAWVHNETGRAVGLPRAIGGIPLDEIGATGYGVCCAVEVALNYCDFSMEGARLAIQGFGSVGIHAARFLVEKGAVLVAAADSRGSIFHETGLDLAELINLKRQGQSVIAAKTGIRGEPDDIVGAHCDIWVPAARPDVVHLGNVDKLNTRLVVQGANIPFTEEAEAELHKRKILVIPDFIANAGGVICAAVEFHGGNQLQAFQTICERVKDNTRQVLDEAKLAGEMPRQAALAMAERRVRTAMASRRWSLF